VVPSFLRPELPDPDEEPGSGDEDEDGEDPEFSSEERYRAFRRECCIAANCDYVIPDLHEHYKRILYRSRRLVRVQELHAPGIIILHEKRTLQAAVNALIDNRHAAERATDDYGRELESLYDMFHFLPEHPPIPGT
jgi:hypothetical protein